ncbi:type II toxin-antitoxin system PemK/MazF family toxin [Streptomyces marincola]|uniref:Growth inhibitor PemK n=1 Tax=Streptomyces marincola TaxID=2878388 RepID=A0A1W7D2V5_9ACTN|nr:type II toxin-antitoxin system PemK/MazF family toxin [Streptomyces marincola]ARQ71344.1 growth inhibitor PemK [Streptomyces marincola]
MDRMDTVRIPGRGGPAATVEIAPRAVEPVRTAYAPEPDGDPDPGEIVWTWVPYEENDGRGKDRPVVAREAGRDTLLAVRLSSRGRARDDAWLPLGTGPWGRGGRDSWADLDRVPRVHPDGMRREACALDRARFHRVVHSLRPRHGWR